VLFTQLIRDFTAIIYEAMPFIVLGVIIAGILEEFVPQQAIGKVIPRNPYIAIALGGLLGLVFPMCECGIIVVMRRLLKKGLPLSVCVAYMLAGPIINVVVMLSTYVAFNPGREEDYILGGPFAVVAWRVGLAYLIAVVTASVVEGLWRKHGTSLLHPNVAAGLEQSSLPMVDEEGGGKRTWGERLNNITATALNDFVEILTFLVIGAALAMGGRAIVRETPALETVFQQVPAVSILLMMGLAVLFCLCSEADAFVAANFDKSAGIGIGAAQTFLPPAAKMAFLVLGPMLDIKLYIMYTRVFRPKLIATIIFFVAAQVFVYTLALHYLYEWLG
jgi:uncharacterized membrane protein YraQ (UPF0718 family)